MAQKKAFPLRLDPATFDALQRWADADLRSLNGQIEYLLRQELRRTKRLPDPDAPVDNDGEATDDDSA